ncbi:hypothetical protein [Agrobacterium sp. SORGH_AS 787]|uniref:hypothetical protein n=1 Tax=Agrobacterium sp. SORGH_AS 787 TaxID=3041775 RepID=UPI00277FAC3A|nr:hypothetical protein [Rhizobium sp. SORGH_AS_0787]
MKCVVPIAGPDLFSKEFGLRPLYDWNGRALIEAVLEARPWRGGLRCEDYIFVVREVDQIDALTDFLRSKWPGCALVTLSNVTGGALFSCLAGMAFVQCHEPVIVDLADIYFDSGLVDPLVHFQEGYKALVPVFRSSDIQFSYLLYEGGVFKRAAEKEVISDLASAGVYMFANLETFLDCAAWSIRNRDDVSWANALYICPMVNALALEGKSVKSPVIEDVQPVGKIFHLK